MSNHARTQQVRAYSQKASLLSSLCVRKRRVIGLNNKEFEKMSHGHASKRVLLYTQQCLILQPEIAKRLGRSAALVLQQLHFFLSAPNDMGKQIQGKRWIYQSIIQWEESLKILSSSTIKRALSRLKAAGLIRTQNFNTQKSNRTLWYTLDYDQLEAFLGEMMIASAPESTSKTTPPVTSESQGLTAKMTASSVQNDSIYNLYSQKQSKTQPDNSTPSLKTGLNPSVPLAEKLLEIWNRETGQQRCLTSKRSQYLVAAYTTRFGRSLEKWKAFCEKVASSDFLMGRVKSTFRASLDWVLKFDTITRIQEGDFGACSEITQPYVREESVSQAVEADLVDSNVPEPEKRLRLQMLEAVGGNAYKSWFQQAAVEVMGEGRVVLRAASAFASDYIQATFGWKLEDALGAQVRYAA